MGDKYDFDFSEDSNDFDFSNEAETVDLAGGDLPPGATYAQTAPNTWQEADASTPASAPRRTVLDTMDIQARSPERQQQEGLQYALDNVDPSVTGSELEDYRRQISDRISALGARMAPSSGYGRDPAQGRAATIRHALEAARKNTHPSFDVTYGAAPGTLVSDSSDQFTQGLLDGASLGLSGEAADFMGNLANPDLPSNVAAIQDAMSSDPALSYGRNLGNMGGQVVPMVASAGLAEAPAALRALGNIGVGATAGWGLAPEGEKNTGAALGAALPAAMEGTSFVASQATPFMSKWTGNMRLGTEGIRPTLTTPSVQGQPAVEQLAEMRALLRGHETPLTATPLEMQGRAETWQRSASDALKNIGKQMEAAGVEAPLPALTAGERAPLVTAAPEVESPLLQRALLPEQAGPEAYGPAIPMAPSLRPAAPTRAVPPVDEFEQFRLAGIEDSARSVRTPYASVVDQPSPPPNVTSVEGLGRPEQFNQRPVQFRAYEQPRSAQMAASFRETPRTGAAPEFTEARARGIMNPLQTASAPVMPEPRGMVNGQPFTVARKTWMELNEAYRASVNAGTPDGSLGRQVAELGGQIENAIRRDLGDGAAQAFRRAQLEHSMASQQASGAIGRDLRINGQIKRPSLPVTALAERVTAILQATPEAFGSVGGDLLRALNRGALPQELFKLSQTNPELRATITRIQEENPQ